MADRDYRRGPDYGGSYGNYYGGTHPWDYAAFPWLGFGYGGFPGYGGFGGRGYGYNYPQEGANLSDEQIRDRIYDALDDNANIPENADIHVEVKDRVVTLTGTVRSKNTKRAAWDAAWSAPGVSDVNNNIAVVGRRQLAQQQLQQPRQGKPS